MLVVSAMILFVITDVVVQGDQGHSWFRQVAWVFARDDVSVTHLAHVISHITVHTPGFVSQALDSGVYWPSFLGGLGGR